MNCKNCGGSGGRKGNKHVKGRRFTCTRRGPGGAELPDVALGSLSDWSSSDESSYGGSGYGDTYSSGSNDY